MKSKIKLILLCALCLLLAVLCAVQAIAWVQSNDAIIAASGDITSSTRGLTGGFETDMTKTQYLMGGSTESVRQGYVPGDRKYYTFVIDVPYTTLQKASTDGLILSLTFQMLEGVTASDTDVRGTGNYQSFMQSLCIEANSVELALLQRTVIAGNTNVQYDVISIGSNLHLTKNTTPAVTNDAINSFYSSVSNTYACHPTIRVSATDWESAASAYKWQNTNDKDRYYVSLMVYVPIWYVDSGAAQDAQKDCYLTISDCIVSW